MMSNNAAQFVLLRQQGRSLKGLSLIQELFVVLPSLLYAWSCLQLLLSLNQIQAYPLWPNLLLPFLLSALAFWCLCHWKRVKPWALALILVLALSIFLAERGLWGRDWDILQNFLQTIRACFNWGLGRSIADELPNLFVMALAMLAPALTMILTQPEQRPSLLLLLLLPLIVFQNEATPQKQILPWLLLALLMVVLCAAQTGVRSRPLTWRQLSYPAMALGLILLVPLSLWGNRVSDSFLRHEATARFLQDLLLPERDGTISYYEFSLKDVGFYPESERLGGPVQLTHEPYMDVLGPSEAFYLRGSIYLSFTGERWQNEAMEPNGRFRNEAPRLEQKMTFDYPGYGGVDADLVASLTRPETIGISPLREQVQISFLGGRPLGLRRSNEGNFYFNPHGQIYNAQVFTYEGYEQDVLFTPPMSSASDRRLYEALSEGKIRIKSRTASRQYEQAVRAADPELAKLLYEANLQPWERLYRLRDYLSQNYSYSLTVAAPDPGENFVLDFLTERKGYCVHFATSLTVLLQDIGFEARYIEGFVVPAAPERTARRVLTDQAHAWTEVYLEGWGWLILDATPDSHQAGLRQDEAPTDTPPPEETPTSSSDPIQSSLEIQTSPSQSFQASSQPSESTRHEQAAPAESALLKTLARLWPYFLLSLLLLSYLFWRSRVERLRHSRQALLALAPAPELAERIWLELQRLARLLGAVQADSATLSQRLQTWQAVWPAATASDTQFLCRILEDWYYGERPPTAQNLSALCDLYIRWNEGFKQKSGRFRYFIHNWIFSPKQPL